MGLGLDAIGRKTGCHAVHTTPHDTACVFAWNPMVCITRAVWHPVEAVNAHHQTDVQVATALRGMTATAQRTSATVYRWRTAALEAALHTTWG